ncbi:MAG TPA: hypothetical protein VFE02_12280 [Candidatus Acidoferrales bacterium]|nr:hypothetical protein [Candidatus Acidoferrales bacterium]
MVTRPAGCKSMPERATGAVDASKEWVKKNLVRPVAKKVGTLTGQIALEEVRKYMVENEAINTALVTRLKENESEITALKTQLMKMERHVHSVRTLALVLAVLVGGLAVVSGLYWWLR